MTVVAAAPSSSSPTPTGTALHPFVLSPSKHPFQAFHKATGSDALRQPRPPLGGWPKSLVLEEGESYLKWNGAIYGGGWLEYARPPVIDGMLYLTNKRLLFKPTFIYWLSRTAVWNFNEIHELGNDKRALTFLLFWPEAWFRWPFYFRANGDLHYFHTTRNERWLAALSDATRLAPRTRSG